MKSFDISGEGEDQRIVRNQTIDDEQQARKTRDFRGKRIRSGTHIDLAFPTVIVTPSHKDRRRKQRLARNVFIGTLMLCITLIFQFFKGINLRVPTGDKQLDLSNVKSINHLSVDAIDSWCLSVSIFMH